MFFYFCLADPKKWSVEDVRSWLLWNSRQHNLPISIDLFNISGATLTSMNEQDFQQRAPQVGWKKKKKKKEEFFTKCAVPVPQYHSAPSTSTWNKNNVAHFFPLFCKHICSQGIYINVYIYTLPGGRCLCKCRLPYTVCVCVSWQSEYRYLREAFSMELDDNDAAQSG